MTVTKINKKAIFVSRCLEGKTSSYTEETPTRLKP